MIEGEELRVEAKERGTAANRTEERDETGEEEAGQPLPRGERGRRGWQVGRKIGKMGQHNRCREGKEG
jgi:hypothetical protein